MKSILNKKLRVKDKEFIVLNDQAQVFIGLRGGYPVFSDNWDEAKPLYDIEQTKYLKYGTSTIEIHYI